MSIANCAKDWIDIFSATAPTAIATVAVVIACQQWITTRHNLKLHLFDKRWVVYEELGKFISSIMTSGKVDEQLRIAFLLNTKGAVFLFDESIQEVLNQVHEKAVDIWTYEQELPGLNGNERSTAIQKQREAKEFLLQKLREKEDLFKKWLKLKH